MRSSLVCIAAFAAPLAAQGYHQDFETLNASASGTAITGQDGYYVPVAGSLDGQVVSYALNTLGVPQNVNGGNNFYAGISQAGNVFARAQRPITYPAAGCHFHYEFDVLCNYVGVGTASNFMGSVSLQPSASAISANLVAAVGTIPGTWDARVSSPAGVAATGDPAFDGLDLNVWHRWGVTVDLANGVYVDFMITNGTTGVTTVFTPSIPLALNNATSGMPTEFRFFTGGADNLFATDNLIMDVGGSYDAFGTGCAGALGVPTLAAMTNERPVVGTTFHAVLGNLPNDVGIITSGFSNTSSGAVGPLPFDLGGAGFPGCFLLVDPVISQILVGAPASQMAAWPFTIPAANAFVGVELFQQGVSLENVAPGAAFSNGGHIKIGY